MNTTTTTRRPSAADLEAAMRRHPAGRAVEAAGMTVLAYSPGAGKTGYGDHACGCRCEWCPQPTATRSPLPVRAARAALDFVGGWVTVALVAGILLGALVVAPLKAHAAPAPAPAATVPLTLADAHGWTPDAILDTTQVEAPSIGDGVILATVEAAWGVADTVALEAWRAYLTADGWVTGPDAVDADGITHADCMILTGDTSYRACADGWTDES